MLRPPAKPGRFTISGFENVVGGHGNDSLTGDARNDRLVGGAGADIPHGGAGAGQRAGGLGADRFDSHAIAEAARDVIVGISVAQRDRIDLHGMDADATLAGKQAFVWTGGAGLNDQAGELRFEAALLEADVNGGVAAEAQIGQVSKAR